MKDIVKQIIKYMLEEPEIKKMIYEELENSSFLIDKKVQKQAIKTSLSLKISHIVIDADNRILLTDYGGIEVPIQGYQARCLYILYLLVPNGIGNKDLEGYKKILESIFDSINNYKHQDASRTKEVISAFLRRKGGVSDATNKINKAFRKVINDENVLQYYLITGQRNGIRQIKLDKCLISIKNKKLKRITEIFSGNKNLI